MSTRVTGVTGWRSPQLSQQLSGEVGPSLAPREPHPGVVPTGSADTGRVCCRIATASKDETLRTWDLGSMAEEHAFTDPEGAMFTSLATIEPVDQRCHHRNGGWGM